MQLRRLMVAALMATACRPPPGPDAGDSDDTQTDDATDTGEGPDGWQISEQVGTERGAIMSVWGPAPDDVFAVGGQPATPDDPSAGVVLHYDGTTWTPQSLPADTAMLNWVYGIDGTTWSVGQKGAIVRRDADNWVSEPSPTDRTLWGIWGASPAELWAVGGNGSIDDPVLLARRDGNWETVDVPPLTADAKGLFKVWGAAGDDVWVVGDLGVTLHYDGNAWNAEETQENADLISVWGSAGEGVIAVGGRANGHIARWLGDGWKVELLPIAGLNGIWVDPTGPVTAVGGQGTIISVEPGGFGYATEESPSPLVLHAVFGFSGGPRFAVGGSLLSAPPWRGVILRHE